MLDALREQLLAPRYLGWLLEGWLVTLAASACVIAAATALGLGLAAARSSTSAGWRRAGATYVAVVRNTPLLVQLFFWYFGMPALLPEAWREWLFASHALHVGPLTVPWPSYELLCALTGLSLYGAAYVSEDIRSGLQGVPAGQGMAARAMGFTAVQVLRYVVLPQALRIALAPLFGQYMNIVKNTSLAMAVGLVELSYASRQVEAETFRTFQSFGIATLLYILSIAALEALSARAVRRWPAGGPR